MPRISKEKALNKINGYLQQVSGMQGISYQKGEQLRESMNISIRNFLTLAFDDGNEKVKQFDDYVNTYIVGTGTQETASEQQEDYEESLRDAKTFLETWKEELEMVDDTSLLNIKKMENSDIKKIFIIHGHDELSTLQLQKLLRDQWDLESLVLADKPPKGRTLIEKFEEEAHKTCFAFAIYTPDDIVKLTDGEYFQARPNTIFEIGWFYGRFGRNNVCILLKKGTQINSDLSGINTIEFEKSVNEMVLEIKGELKEAGII